MKKYITGLFIVVIMVAACEKKVDSIDTYSVTVDFRASGPKVITGDVELNPKDSIYFDFTITANEDMAYVEIQKNGVRIDTFNLPSSNRRSFSHVKGYMADSAAGDYNYRIVGRTSLARFLGDGGKNIKVTIKPDFLFWSYRVLKVPDTTTKVNKCYYAATTGNIYSYTEGAANSALIDFAYYYDTTSSQKHSIYALSSAQPQLAYYDISTWTKNATLLKKMPSSVNFVTGLTSSGAINTLIKNNMTSGTVGKVFALTSANGNNVVGFRTVGGKYGAILIRYTNQDSPAKETTVEIDVKIQK